MKIQAQNLGSVALRQWFCAEGTKDFWDVTETFFSFGQMFSVKIPRRAQGLFYEVDEHTFSALNGLLSQQTTAVNFFISDK